MESATNYIHPSQRGQQWLQAFAAAVFNGYYLAKPVSHHYLYTHTVCIHHTGLLDPDYRVQQGSGYLRGSRLSGPESEMHRSQHQGLGRAHSCRQGGWGCSMSVAAAPSVNPGVRALFSRGSLSSSLPGEAALRKEDGGTLGQCFPAGSPCGMADRDGGFRGSRQSGIQGLWGLKSQSRKAQPDEEAVGGRPGCPWSAGMPGPGYCHYLTRKIWMCGGPLDNCPITTNLAVPARGVLVWHSGVDTVPKAGFS